MYMYVNVYMYMYAKYYLMHVNLRLFYVLRVVDA